MCLCRRQRVRFQPLYLRQHLHRRDRQVPLHLSSWPYRGPLPSRSVGSRYADSIGSKVLARLPLPSRSVGSGYADSVVSKHGPILGPCVKGTCSAPAAKRVSGVRPCRFNGVKVTCLPAAKRVSGVRLCRFNRVKGTCPAPAAKQVSGVRLCRFSSVKAWTYIRSMCQRYLPGSRCQAGQWGQAMQIQ